MNFTGKSLIDPAQIEWAIQQRFSPFPELTMEMLTAQLNAFRIGDLAPAARTWEMMLERDGDLAADANKRFEDLAGRSWEIMPVDRSVQALRHADALRYFYDHLCVTSILEQDETGDVALLLYQMAGAIAFRYSVHEIILRVDSPKDHKASALFQHVPVWFFESRRGWLGRLKQMFDIYGEPLAEGQWLPAVGKGWMRPCSVAYAIKHFPLADWMLYCRRFGLPGIQGLTDAQKDSKEWNDFAQALMAYSNDFVTLTNRANEIRLVESSGKGELPFERLIELTNRVYTKLFRGSDLATGSRSSASGRNAVGASVQQGEKDILGKYDCRWASGILNARVDSPLLRYLFNEEPMAFVKIIHPEETDAETDLRTAAFCVTNGVPISVRSARERFNWPEPQPGEAVINASALATAIQP